MPIKPPASAAGAAAPRETDRLRFDPTTIGSPGLRQNGGYIAEEFLKDLSGVNGRKKFREMAENDWVCGAILFAIENLIRGVEWTAQAADDTAEAEAAKAFVEEVLVDMSTSFDTVLTEICTMFTFGFAPMEITWKRRVAGTDDMGLPISRFTDGKIGIASIALRKQETVVRWDIDDADGRIYGFWQQPYTRPQVYIPTPKTLLFRTTPVANNPEGRSILRTAYRSWFYRSRIEEIEAIGIERDLAGLPMVRIPATLMDPNASIEDKAVYQAYRRLVTQVRRDQQEGIILPSNRDQSGNLLFEFELLTTGGSRSFDTNAVLTRYDRATATAVLADFIFLGQQAVGSFALSSDKTALFAAAIQAFLSKAIAERFNEDLLPRLWTLNGFDFAAMPTLVPADIEEASLGEVGALIQVLTGAGAQLFPDRELENHLRRRAGLPPAPEDGAEDMIDTPDAPQPGEDDPADTEDAADDE